MFAESGVPSLTCNPLPLSLSMVPVILKDSPATGFAVIASTTSKVVERIVTVERFL
ncbi:MAG: Uncharacterised protein [Methanobacteriota archaeon]|nr:MAG: Uncharacterised protein [Euryarchaeota archaeon]